MLYVDKEKCTACGACFQSCPKGCISIETNSHGFLYPHLNEVVCIECGKCLRACPINSDKNVNSSDQKAYAVVHKNHNVLMNSTSGGAFSAIAEYVLKQQGVVYGCAYTEHLNVRHIRIDNIEDLCRINGSKYIQSNTGMTFRQAEQDLKNGKIVLYSGTPCQVAGLNAFLNQPYDNLITVDIICHGVPSQAYFDKFIEWYERSNNVMLSNLSFRSKKAKGLRGAGTYVGTYEGVYVRTGKPFKKKLNYFDSYYYFYFLNSDIYRESCYSCDYAKIERVGDFTLGDFWGAEGQAVPFSVDDGCSLMIANTKKANALLEKFNIKFWEVPISFAVEHNKQLKLPSNMSHKRFELLEEYRNCSAEVIQKNFKIKNKKAIVKGKLKYLVPSGLKKILLKIRYKR